MSLFELKLTMNMGLFFMSFSSMIDCICNRETCTCQNKSKIYRSHLAPFLCLYAFVLTLKMLTFVFSLLSSKHFQCLCISFEWESCLYVRGRRDECCGDTRCVTCRMRRFVNGRTTTKYGQTNEGITRISKESQRCCDDATE